MTVSLLCVRLALAVLLLAPAVVSGMSDPAALVRESMAERVLEQIDEIESASVEAKLRIHASLTEGQPDASAQEAIRLAIAQRLALIGSEESLPILEVWSRDSVRVTTLVEGCRRPVELPLFDYPTAAAEAARLIRWRSESSRLSKRLGGDPQAWAAALMEFPAAPEVWALAAREQDGTVATSIIGAIHAPVPDQAAAAVVELILASSALPMESVLGALPDHLVQRLYEERHRLDSETMASLDTFFANSPATRSRWRMSEWSRKDARQLPLESPEAALLASRKLDALELAEQVQVAAEQVVLALMLQDCVQSREELRRLYTSGRLPSELAEKVMTWLKR
jgi:hypothetical protein